MHRRLKVEITIFHYEDNHFFNRRILLANSTYKIPEVTTYVLFTAKKTYFSLDVFQSNSQIPFPEDDRVLTRLKNLFDVSPQTPHIDDDRDEDEDNNKMPPLPLSSQQEP